MVSLYLEASSPSFYSKYLALAFKTNNKFGHLPVNAGYILCQFIDLVYLLIYVSQCFQPVTDKLHP